MALDFAALVLGPAMAVFADPIVLTPTASLPGAPAYAARGVFAQKPVQVQVEGGGFMSDVQPTLGIALSDFPTPPKQGDSFVRTGITWFVWDIVPDGQGGADLTIKETSPL